LEELRSDINTIYFFYLEDIIVNVSFKLPKYNYSKPQQF